MERVSFVMRVKAGKQDEYIRRHREVWPEVLTNLRRAGVHKMSIFASGLEVFLYMEVENYAQAVCSLNTNPELIRWEEFMAPIMDEFTHGSFDPTNAYPDSLPEIFFWEAEDHHAKSQQFHKKGAEAVASSPPHYLPSRQSPVQS